MSTKSLFLGMEQAKNLPDLSPPFKEHQYSIEKIINEEKDEYVYMYFWFDENGELRHNIECTPFMQYLTIKVYSLRIEHPNFLEIIKSNIEDWINNDCIWMHDDVRQELVKNAKDRVEKLILSRPNPHLLECSVDYRGYGQVEFWVD